MTKRGTKVSKELPMAVESSEVASTLLTKKRAKNNAKLPSPKAKHPKKMQVKKTPVKRKPAPPEKKPFIADNPAGIKPEPTSSAESVISEIEEVKDPSVKELLYRLMGHVDVLSKRTRHEPCSESDFRRMVDHLKTVCPPPKSCKVTVERSLTGEMQHEHGYVCKERQNFMIYIDKSLTYYECEDKLIHEWAHMLNWKPHHPLEGDHGPTWGVTFALVYRKYHGVE
jgi:hypothetical protein